MTEKNKEQTYSAKNIVALDPREHVRHRPGMYIGGVGRQALNFLIFEVIDRAVDSTIIGRCDHISITLYPDHIVTIQDTDDAVPEQLATGEYMFAPLRDGDSNPDHYSYLWHQRPILSEGRGYLEKDGLHRITIMVVNALSKFMTIDFRYNDFVWKRTYQKGIPYGAIQKHKANDSKLNGVTVTLQPDFTIFDENDFDLAIIGEYCGKLAYLLPELTITLNDERTLHHHKNTFHYPDGIQSMVHELNQNKTPKHDVIHTRQVVPHTNQWGISQDIIVEVAFQYTESDETILQCYANTGLTKYGGTHLEGFRSALMTYLNGAKKTHFSLEEIEHGLTAVINIVYSGAAFVNNAWWEVTSPEVFDAVLQTTYALLVDAKLRDTIRKHIQDKK